VNLANKSLHFCAFFANFDALALQAEGNNPYPCGYIYYINTDNLTKEGIMKKVLFVAAFAVFASTQAFAIIGAGAHYVTNLGTLKGETESINLGNSDIGQIDLKRTDVSTLQGIGFKLWIDILPVVDIEGTFNITATRYNTSLNTPLLGDIPLEYEPEAPYNMVFGKASPIFGLFSGDVSVTYPIDFLPVIRPYAGLGISYMASIPIMNKKFVEGMGPDLIDILGQDPANPDKQKMGKALTEALKKADYKTGLGGHAIAGVRLKLPIIPIAAYANTKFYFGGDIDKKFSQGVVFEVGGGLAI
jgi:hypothetical protein